MRAESAVMVGVALLGWATGTAIMITVSTVTATQTVVSATILGLMWLVIGLAINISEQG